MLGIINTVCYIEILNATVCSELYIQTHTRIPPLQQPLFLYIFFSTLSRPLVLFFAEASTSVR
jgi:hypothetical protein